MNDSNTSKHTANPFADNVDHSRKDKLRGRRTSGILKFITLSFFITWILVIGYFLVYPILPQFQNFKSKMKDFDPYLLGYNVTTQLFVSISPPSYSMSESEVGDQGDEGPKSIEYVDASTVELSNLEKLETRIEIGSAGINGRVVDGYSQESMMRGFWHYPASSVPGERGNTVIFGHRYNNLPPNTETFFNLDKVVVGDKVLVSKGDETLWYTVVYKDVVGKYDDAMLKSSGEYQLTLITCTPLWTSEKRLVVVAIQDRVSSVI